MFLIFLHLPIAFTAICVYTVIVTIITVKTLIAEKEANRLQLIISNTSGIPIYQQIKEQIRDAILGGELQEGQMLPSLRQLAKELKISVLTITRAYTELEQEGYVTNM